MFVIGLQTVAVADDRFAIAMTIAIGLILVIMAAWDVNIARMAQGRRDAWLTPSDEPGPMWARWLVGALGATLLLAGLIRVVVR